jgi:hypothetical protein
MRNTKMVRTVAIIVVIGMVLTGAVALVGLFM